MRRFYKKIKDLIVILKEQSYSLTRERVYLLIRYLFAGGISFVTNIALLFVFIEYFKWWYLIASTVSFIISVVVSFLAQKFITFQEKSIDDINNQMVKYVIIALFNVLANAGIVFVLVDILNVNVLISQIISAGFIAVWSLFVYRFIIFKK